MQVHGHGPTKLIVRLLLTVNCHTPRSVRKHLQIQARSQHQWLQSP